MNKAVFRSVSAPFDVNLEVTNECNCLCLHCYNSSGPKGANELTTDEIKGLLDQLAELSVFSVHFSGGECFLREDILVLLDYAVSKGFGVSVTTNGSKLTSEVAQFLFDRGVKVEVSLDSLDDATHDWFRGYPGLCSQVKALIPMLKAKGLHVSVSTVVGAFNSSGIEDLIGWCQSVGVDTLSISDILPVGRAIDNWTSLSLPTKQKKWLFHRLQQAVERVKPMELLVHFAYDFLFDRTLCAECNAGLINCTISHDGLLKACPFYPPLAEDSLRRKPFAELWRKSELLQQFRSGWIVEECTSCKFWQKNCEGGCRAVALLLAGSFNAKAPTCPLRKNMRLTPA